MLFTLTTKHKSGFFSGLFIKLTDGGISWRDFLISGTDFKPKGIAGAGSGNKEII